MLKRLRRLDLILANSRGVGFIQVLMASTAIAGLAVIGLQLAKDQKRLAKETYHTYLVEYFTQEVTHLLYNNITCRATFTGINPSDGKIDSLREPIVSNGESQGFHLLFPAQSSGSGDGGLYAGQISVMEYRLNGSAPEANVEKNISMLEIILKVESKSQPVTKSIPLSFKQDETGLISSCSTRVVLGEGPAEGFWKKKDDGLSLKNLSVVVGDIEDRGAGLSIFGKLRILPEDQERACTRQIEGLLIKNAKGNLVYCLNEKWMPFGHSVVPWNDSKKYRIGIKKTGIEVLETSEHRFCYLIRQSKNSTSDRCILERASDKFYERYLLKASSSAPVTNLDCEVYCVD